MTPPPDDDPAPADLSADHRRRVRMTAAGRDCDPVPKVADAGRVVDSPAGPVQVMHNGLRVLADAYQGRWQTEVIHRLAGHHEPQEEWAFHELLKHAAPGGAMVELGSYWAYYALWFLRAVPGGTAYLVEPDPGYLDVGRRNFALNGAAGHFTPAAVGRVSTPPAPFRCESDGQVRAVPVVSVDDFLAGHGLRRVEVLLADVQGAELDALEGAAKSFAAGLVRFVVVSTHHHSISGDPLTHQKCLKFLRDRGAHVLCEHTVAESFSGDGLVVAAMRAEDRGMPPVRVSYNRAGESLFREVEYDLADARAENAALKAELRRLAAGLGQFAAGLGRLAGG